MEYAQYEKIAAEIRKDVIREVHSAGSGHPGGSLSAADIVTALYFREMNIDPENPEMCIRDSRLHDFQSCSFGQLGHICIQSGLFPPI